MNLYHIKLVNGDEIISQTQAATDPEKYFLLNPLEMNNVVDPTSGKTSCVLHSYAPFASNKTTIELSKNQVIAISRVEGEMVNYYKASLEYSVLFGIQDTDDKVKAATEYLKLYIKQQIEGKIDSSDDPFSDLFDEVSEEDLDEETYESITSANTTIH